MRRRARGVIAHGCILSQIHFSAAVCVCVYIYIYIYGRYNGSPGLPIVKGSPRRSSQ
jgi:hypothetical protein